jgi:hypothetical protein
LEQAGSLASITAKRYDCDAAVRLLVQQLDAEHDRLTQGEVGSLESSWKQRLGLLGAHAVAECADGEWHGRLIDVGWDGVQLETPSGIVRLLPETVRHLRPV